MEKSFMREAGEASEKSSERYKRPGSSRHLDLQQGFESGAKWAKRYFETQLSPEIEKFQLLLIEERRSRQAVEKIMSGKTRELIDERDEAVKLLREAYDHLENSPLYTNADEIKAFLSKTTKP